MQVLLSGRPSRLGRAVVADMADLLERGPRSDDNTATTVDLLQANPLTGWGGAEGRPVGALRNWNAPVDGGLEAGRRATTVARQTCAL